MGVADEPVALQVRFILLRAIRRIRPDPRTGVRGIEQSLAQEPAVVPAGIGHHPATDKSIPSVDARVRFVPEGRDGNLRMPRARGVGPGPTGLDRPSRVDIFLRCLGRLVRLDLPRRLPCLRRLLLRAGVSLLGPSRHRTVHDLSGHGNESGCTDRVGEPPDKAVDRTHPCQSLPEHPDRLHVGHPISQPKARKADLVAVVSLNQRVSVENTSVFLSCKEPSEKEPTELLE